MTSSSPLGRALSWLLPLLAWLLPSLALVATIWPLPMHPAARLLGAPEIEAVEHLWTLWLGSRDGPLVIDTTLASFPLGYRWVLADPLNLLFFAPVAWLLGPWTPAAPVVAFHAVQVANLLLAAATAVLVGRLLLGERAAPAWATATLALAAPTLAGPLVTGMTEASALWTAPLAALLLKPAAERGGAWVPAAAVAAVSAGWAGPYAALYAALLAPLVLLSLLPTLRAAPRTTLLRLALVLLPAGALVAPVGWAVATQRGEGLPGAASMLPQVLSAPGLPQSRALGADPLAVVLPRPPGDPGVVSATWLTTGGLALGLWTLLRQARRAPLGLALVGGSVVLGLGVYLQVGEHLPRVGGRLLLLPAGLLSLAFEPLGRAARWHRMLAVAAILLAPATAAALRALAARTPRPALVLPALVLLVAAEGPLLSPLPWPRPSQEARPPPLYAALDAPGAIIAIPKAAQRTQGQTRSAARALLWQVQHGRPFAEKPMYQKTEPALHALRDAVRAAAQQGDVARAGRARGELAALGYAWIVHHDDPGNSVRGQQLRAVLGPPDVEVEGDLAWRLR